MSAINAITSVSQPTATNRVAEQKGAEKSPESEGTFVDALSGFVGDVNDLQSRAGELQRQLIAGEGPDLHQVLITSEQAGIAFELLLEVRNKLVEAYQQLMRMPV